MPRRATRPLARRMKCSFMWDTTENAMRVFDIPRPFWTRLIGILAMLASACTSERVPPLPVAIAAAGAEQGLDTPPSPRTAPPLTPSPTFRVFGEHGPIPGARIAVRTRDGRRWQELQSDASGAFAGDIPADGFVLAVAPGMAPSTRQGPGDVHLVKREAAPERWVARRRDGQTVVEVVRGDPRFPRAEGLAPAAPEDAAPANPFSDIEGHPLRDHVHALASRGILAGDGDGRFRPDDDVSRAETVALLLRALEQPLSSTMGPFHDVAPEAWYARAVSTAHQLGLASGYPDGTFLPEANVTRAELGALLHRALRLEDSAPTGDVVDGSSEQPLVDVPHHHWAHRALSQLQALCGVFDTPGGELRPDVPATRAESAAATSRMLACAAGRPLGVGERMANAGASAAWSTWSRHHALRDATGFGTHYGDTSAFHALSPDDKAAYIAAHAGPEPPLSPEAMTRSSCVEYSMELTASAFGELTPADAWQALDMQVRRASLRGTALAGALVDAGWQAVYFNWDTTYQGFAHPDLEHSYALSVARSDASYYGVPLRGLLLDGAHDERIRRAMDSVRFGVLVLRGGYHVVVIVDGVVHELARSEGPDEHVLYTDPWRDIVDIYAKEVHGGGLAGDEKARKMWNSGVLILPSGRVPAGTTAL